ncbi:replication protein RepA [Corynebacterium sp. UMB4614]|uniref:replication protein RepA n=1 Tax=Corynebacterium sp. UMB4614 TaxID=3046334 RepID=UPI00254E9687|nr:replication protein RepA [Corynebacterium sp. UMB4614]MDK7135767.1 replication protein RepA [Corynebacterium sp. UMB4614]
MQPPHNPNERRAKLEAVKELARRQEHDAAQDLLQAQDVGYTSKLFVQALFPYRKTEGNNRTVETPQGTITILSQRGVPYGKYPRLIMAYIITRAVANAGRLKEGNITHEEALRIPLGHSMSHFLQAIGITGRGTGGATGNLKNIREQLLRIAGSFITVQSDDGVHARGRNTQILEDWNLWFDSRDPNQGSFMESELVLTPQFFKHIAEAPIPIDLNVLRELNKPRAMDLYIWLTVKQYWLAKNNRDAYTFSWDMIAANFATRELKTSNDLAHFRTEIKKSIADILQTWPQAGIEASTDGVTVTRTAHQFSRNRHAQRLTNPIAEKKRPAGCFLFAPKTVCAYLPLLLRIFTVTAAHIYRYRKTCCAYLPLLLRIFTVTAAHIYRYRGSYPQGFTCGFTYFPRWLITISL